MRLLALAAAFVLAAFPAAARPLTEQETTTLTRAVNGYLNAIKAANSEKIVAAIPPRIVNVFAGTAGIEAREIQSALVAQTREMMKGSKFRDMAADTSALEAGDATLGDGTPVTWVVVPTSFTAEVGESRTRNSQALLALSEGGEWYFVRMDGPQQKQIVSIAYPFLADVDMPAPVISPTQ